MQITIKTRTTLLSRWRCMKTRNGFPRLVDEAAEVGSMEFRSFPRIKPRSIRRQLALARIVHEQAIGRMAPHVGWASVPVQAGGTTKMATLSAQAKRANGQRVGAGAAAVVRSTKGRGPSGSSRTA